MKSKYALCVNNDKHEESLEINKYYLICGEIEDLYIIDTKHATGVHYYKKRFKLIEEPNEIRVMKILYLKGDKNGTN